MKKSAITVLAIAISLMIAASAYAAVKQGKEQVIRVEGYAAINGAANVSDLRSAAIDDALAMAVRQAVGVMLDSQTYTIDFELFEKSIITRAKGYARVGKILYETRLPDQYVVGIEAVVSTDSLTDDIDAIRLDIMRAGDPRIVVVVPEELLFRRQVPDPAGETEIIRQLTENGFTVVDQTEVAEIRYGTAVEKMMAGDFSQSDKIFRNKADILIVGEAIAERVGDVGGGLISCRARIEIKAIEIGTGRIITSFAAHEAGIDITDILAGKKAIENAAAVVADHLKNKLFGYVKSGARNVQIKIENIADHKTLSSIRTAILNAGGVSMVYLRSYSGNVAVFDVEGSCGAELLASRLDKIDLRNMSLIINSITMRRIDAKIISLVGF